jgi:hypothetical protein
MPSLFLTSAALAAACNDGQPDNEGAACRSSGRGDTYTAGLQHKGTNAVYDFKLMSAMPAPPMLNLNTWLIQINWEATGAPVTGASLTITPFMPDHQQGADTPQTQEQSTPGQYQIANINMGMPGYWEITMSAKTPDNVEDTVVYKFCIQP